jgi:hypothetical protein
MFVARPVKFATSQFAQHITGVTGTVDRNRRNLFAGLLRAAIGARQ